MRYWNIKFVYNKASVKSTALQNCTGMRNHNLSTKPHQILMDYRMCLAICIVTKPHFGKVCVFFTNTVKVGAVWLMHCCVVILVVGINNDYVFKRKTASTLKKGV